jgi:hypothetical protein
MLTGWRVGGSGEDLEGPLTCARNHDEMKHAASLARCSHRPAARRSPLDPTSHHGLLFALVLHSPHSLLSTGREFEYPNAATLAAAVRVNDLLSNVSAGSEESSIQEVPFLLVLF